MLEALLQALRSLMRPRMLGLVLWPLLGALALWGLVYAFAWQSLTQALEHLLDWAVNAGWIGQDLAATISKWVVWAVLLVLLLPLTQATALLITSTIAMPLMVADVGARDYPQLQPRGNGGGLWTSTWNGLSATLIFLVLWIVTLPLWLFGLPAVVLPVLLTGWLNDRLFRYDALAAHADAGEYKRLAKAQRLPFLGLGIIAALLQSLPIVNLFVPVYAGLSFIHYGLSELQRERSAGPGSAAPRNW